jgi:phage baseplate assembly protein W
MSYSFGLKDGDIALTGSIVTMVSGIDKLKQDIDLWLREIYGVDRFHPDYGSILQDFIGGVIGPVVMHDIEVEVARVLGNLQALQLRRISVNPSKYTPDELLRSVVSVKSTQSYDAIYVNVVFESADGTVGSTSLGVTT